MLRVGGLPIDDDKTCVGSPTGVPKGIFFLCVLPLSSVLLISRLPSAVVELSSCPLPVDRDNDGKKEIASRVRSVKLTNRGCVRLTNDDSVLVIGKLSPKRFTGVVKGVVAIRRKPDGQPQVVMVMACSIDLEDC